VKISAIQKLTLLDFPGHVACTVFTAGCDLRCHCCHNAEFVLPEKISKIAKDFIPETAFFKFLETRRGLLDGVCVTGGEPAVQPDLADFLRQIKQRGFLVKLDTNGNHPTVIKSLLDADLLDYIAMDVKASPARYHEFTGKAAGDNVTASRDLIMASGVDYEFRTTLVRQFHDTREYEKVLEFVKGAKRYHLQNFQTRGGCLNAAWEDFAGFTKAELDMMCEKAKAYVGECTIRT
jgi:pyruvate formate lyase activating enzyme